MFCVANSVPSTEGTEFYVTFINNLDEYNDLQLKLVASSKNDAMVFVSNPQTHWEQTFTVLAGKTSEIGIPIEQAYTESSGSKEQHGLRVSSTAPISLYALNHSSFSYDATNILPVAALGNNYVIQTYEEESFSKEFAVVATTDNTTITITPHARTKDGKVKDVPFQIVLNEGETYQVMSLDNSADFSGTHVVSTKPIAVFSGHRCANIPVGNIWCDHIVEQQTPIFLWGKHFVVTKTDGQLGNQVSLTASSNNTQIKINGSTKATIGSYETYTFRLENNSAYIETSKPVECYLYIEGAYNNEMHGDPSSVHISPLEQNMQHLTFTTFQSNVTRAHYVNIVTTTEGSASLMLNGRTIAEKFMTVQGNPKYKFAMISLNPGTHTLVSPQGGFTGYMYGLGWCESYAYSMGSATINLQTAILVDDVPHEDLVYDENRCYMKEIKFSPNVNVDYESILWKFGDGTTSNQPVVIHQYPSAGTYSVQMIVSNGTETDTARTTLVLKDIYKDTIFAEICAGDYYVIDGIQHGTAGEYTHVLTSSAGCDSIVTLKLSVHDSYLAQEEYSIVSGSSFKWRNRWYHNAGVYYDTLPTIHNCDSVFELTLNVIDSDAEEIYDTICWKPFYTFHGYDFPLPSVEDYKSQDYVDYTLEYRDIVACTTHTIHLAISTIADGTYITNDTIQFGTPYTWMGEQYTETGTFTKTISSGYECTQEYILNLVVLPFPIVKTEASLCTGTPYEFRGKIYTEPGVYRDTAFTDAGIVGIYQLTLTDSRTYENMYITTTGSYTLNGHTYTESGTYVQKLTNAAGCDSILTLYLGIDENCLITTEESAVLCPGNSFIWNNQTVDAAKDYTFTTTALSGCDSTAILHVTLGTIKQTNLPIEICEGDYYRYGSDKLSEAKDYTYTYTSAEGCDSVVTITLTYKDTYAITIKDTIKQGQTYTWDGDTYNTSGSYIKGYVAENNCDSVVTLDLFVAEPVYHEFSGSTCGTPYIWDGRTYSESGDYSYTYTSHLKGDSIVTLHLSILAHTDSIEVVTICHGETHTWHGQTFSESTTTSETIPNAVGCDSVCTLQLTVLPKLTGDTSATFCNGTPFMWHGIPYATGGDYPYTYTSKVAPYCDSIVTLHLTQLEPTDSVENVTLCYGESHIWHGQTFTSSTSVTETIPNAVGCDSVCTLNLTILPALIGDTSATFCSGTPFIWHSISYSIGGDYPYTYTSKVAPYCDSIVTLHLTQLEHSDSIEVVAICYGETHTWHGQTFSESTTTSETIPNAVGCDSVCTLQLTVVPELTGDTSATFCNDTPFMWHGTPYATGGDYQHTYTSKVAPYCDSIVTLHLTQLEPTDSIETVTLCAGGSYSWHGRTYTTSTNETETITNSVGCDSLCTLNLTILPVLTGTTTATITEGATYTWNGQPYTAEGDYTQTLTTDAGCDSIVTLYLTVNPLIYDILMRAQCADDPFVEFELQADDGLIHQLQFAFSQKALDQHFPDTTVTITTSLIQIPNSARAGIYDVAISPLFDQQLLDTRNYQFTLLYPSSVLDQHWDDFIGVLTNPYNGGYDFVGFQWYKNGSPITGENHSYLYQPLEMGSPYSAMLEESDGTKLMTCEIIATPQTEISLYPTLSQPRQIISLHSSEDVTIWLYDSLGKLLYTNSFERGDSQFAAPQDHGIYIVKIQQTGEKGESETKKLIVR